VSTTARAYLSRADTFEVIEELRARPPLACACRGQRSSGCARRGDSRMSECRATRSAFLRRRFATSRNARAMDRPAGLPHWSGVPGGGPACSANAVFSPAKLLRPRAVRTASWVNHGVLVMAHWWRETPDQAVVATQAGGREQELSSLKPSSPRLFHRPAVRGALQVRSPPARSFRARL
jgi:hypothetical protein